MILIDIYIYNFNNKVQYKKRDTHTFFKKEYEEFSAKKELIIIIIYI
jgi:hypothetical protein